VYQVLKESKTVKVIVSGNAKITPYGKRKFIPLIKKGGRNGARKGILTPDGIIGRRSHDQTGEVV
jgi:hypothetical protein